MVEHKVDYCSHCQTTMIRCGNCGNNCCNGGYGEVNGEKCKDCPSAYQMQKDMWENE